MGALSSSKAPPGRPTEEAFKEKLDGYLQLKEAGANNHRYREVVEELRSFERGEGEALVWERYYAGWERKDFAKILKGLGETVAN